MTMNKTIAIILLGTLFVACTKQENFDMQAAQKTIASQTHAFTKAHITKDTAFLNNIFTKDARIFPPNSEVVSGRKSIAKLNEDWVNYGIYEFREVSVSFYGNREYLIDEGNYYLKYGPQNTVDSGKYVNIWKQVKGEWKLYSNIWNTNAPVATPEVK